jgi:hypothetical protein
VTIESRDASASRPRISALFIALAIALACADNFADPDLWRHIMAGNAMLHTGHILVRDAWSYSVAGFPIRIHEWLSEVLFALAYQSGGVAGLKLIKVLCAAVTIGALAIGLAQTAASIRIQRMILILAGGALTIQMQYRPQLFTFAMLSIVMATIAIEVYRGGARLWPLIPMFALWANLHGGFTTGLGALGLAASVIAIFEMSAGKIPARGRRLGIVTILAAGATVLNPNGIGIWTNVLHSVSDPLLRQIVSDWVPLPVLLMSIWKTSAVGLMQLVLALGLFGAFLYSVVMAPTLDDAPIMAVAMVFIGAGFYMVRNLALGVIAVAIPLVHHLDLALAKRARSDADSKSAELDPIPVRIAILIAVAAIAIVMFANRLPNFAPQPEGAVDFMNAHGLHGNILNQFEWGDYIVWHQPQSRIFIDVRAELVYPDYVMREYADFHYGKPGAERALEKYPTDFILIKPEMSGYRLIASDPAWRILYQDRVAALFAPTSAIERAPEISKTQIFKSDDRGKYFP